MKKERIPNNLLNKYVKYALSGIRRGKILAQKIVPFIHNKNLEILDFGSGNGLPAYGMAKIFDGNITGIEINQESLKTAKTWLKKSGINNISFEDTNIENIKRKFDLIVANNVLEHVPNRLQYLNLLNSLLKSKGYLYVKTTNRICVYNIFRDNHVNLPFICILNKKIRNKIIRKVLKLKSNDIFDYSFKWELQNLFKKSSFEIVKDFRPFNHFFMAHEYLVRRKD